MKKTYSMDQLDCAACAAKMEEAASQVPGVEELRINFLTKTMSLTASEDHFEQVAPKRYGGLPACGTGMPGVRSKARHSGSP